MAIPKQPSVTTFFLLALVALSITITSGAVECNGVISIYWGQKTEQQEGTLKSLCSTGSYNIVILERLVVYDYGRTPTLNLTDHCGSSSCSKLQPEIQYCQLIGVKVLLSVDLFKISSRKYRNTKSSEDAEQKLVSFLSEEFLSGKPGPLGSVSLDGFDLGYVEDTENLKWDKVVWLISATAPKRVYLSAAPQCEYPDWELGSAINTGLLDYLWIEFYYQKPCIYSNGDASNLLEAWKTWTQMVPNSLIFLGLMPSPSKNLPGYIPPEDLISKVLPTAKEAENYGGVMIYDRHFDKMTNYTAKIEHSVPNVCDAASNSYYGLRMPV